ncbi:MAG: ATP-binding protein, partial [Bacteroidota bacterium]
INQLNIEYETEKKEKENLRLENELTTAALKATEQRAQRNLIIGLASVVLLLAMGGFVWYRYRQRILLKEKALELEQERARKEQQRKEAEKLQELDAMKTRFFTNISHEFRTPLTLILGQNEQLQRAVPDLGLQNRFQMVDRNGHRLLDLINQVLDVAKLEAGGMQLEPASLNAIPFLKHMLFSFESLAKEQGIRLAFESQLSRLETAFDLKKMERILFNLLSNAVKFSKPDTEIKMLVKQQEQQMIIGIQDSGVGIKAEQLPNIFDRFYQADSSEQQPQPGTGIGLSLVKELVDLHEGAISVESKLDQGTTFWLRLPIPAELSVFPAAPGERLTQLNPAALPVQGLEIAATESNDSQTQVLLVEDNSDIRAYVRDQLLSFGYRVIEAADGQAGLAKAKEHLPDLIISDIMMPKLDGYGVAAGLRDDEKTSHIPLILLTSKASDESKIKGFELGIDDYLLKPFNTDELKVRVANLIEQRQRLRERFTSSMIIRPKEVSTVPLDQQFLQKVLNLIEDNLNNEQFGVEFLSEEVGMSVTHLNRKLRALVDQSAGKMIRSMRLQRAADLLKQQASTISDIAYDLGFSNPTHFTRAFKKQFGMSPSEYAKNPV